MNEVKIAVFDLGGTFLLPKSGSWYITSPVREQLNTMCCTKDEIAEAIAQARKVTKNDILASTVEQEIRIYTRFYQAFFTALDACGRVSEDDLLRLARYRSSASELYELNYEAIELIGDISRHTETVLFSNTWPSVILLLKQAGVLELFDHKVFSCDVGLKKPDPAFFELLCSEVQHPASDIVMYDDSVKNIEIAAKCGMETRLVTAASFASTLREDFWEA